MQKNLPSRKVYQIECRDLKFQPVVSPHWEPQYSIIALGKLDIYRECYNWFNKWKGFYRILEINLLTLIDSEEVKVRVHIHYNPNTKEIAEYSVMISEDNRLIEDYISKLDCIYDSTVFRENYDILKMVPDISLFREDFISQFETNCEKILLELI